MRPAGVLAGQWWKSRIGALALWLATTASVAAPIRVVDDVGRSLTLPAPPARIVTLAPSAAEMLFAIGAGGRIVGAAEYSDQPAEARRIPRVGDSQALDLERIVALRPDLLVVWPGGNSAAQIATIERLKIPMYHQRIERLADVPASLRRLGRLTGQTAGADAAAARIASRLDDLRAKYGRGKPQRVLLQIWSRPIFTVGAKQVLTDAVGYCGARNVFDDLSGMSPTITEEAAIARDPDVIVAIAPPGAAKEWLAPWRRFPALKATRAGNLVPFEDQRLARLGPSLVDATEALCAVLATARGRSSAAARL